MSKSDSIVSFFSRIYELKDQLSITGETINDKELVLLAMNGLPPSWESFIQVISSKSDFLTFERLRTDCIQEEQRLEGALANLTM